MSWENRDYNQGRSGWRDSYSGGGGFGGGGGGGGNFRGGIPGVSANLPAVTMWLLGINVLVSLVDWVLTGSLRGDRLSASGGWGYFSLDTAIYKLQAWRFITYAFLHGGVLHLLFNMIGLWVFGSMMERYWGSRRYLLFYLLCGVGGAALFALASLIPGFAGLTPDTPIVGASACVLGLVAGCILKYPKDEIRLMFIPISFTIQVLGWLYIGFDVLNVLAGSAAAGSAIAHLGGALAGFALVRYPSPLGVADRLKIPDLREKLAERQRLAQQRESQKHQEEVDRLLDKVRDHGLHSLTKRERATLEKDTRMKRGE